jgi:hypothetical protein
MSNENVVETVTGLHGFAKGWTIFMIVYCAAFAMSLFSYLGSGSSVAGFILVIIIFSIGMITGLTLMLKGRAFGFWVLFGSSLPITLLNGTHLGSYVATTSGGLVLVAITFFIVRKQLGIFVKKA